MYKSPRMNIQEKKPQSYFSHSVGFIITDQIRQTVAITIIKILLIYSKHRDILVMGLAQSTHVALKVDKAYKVHASEKSRQLVRLLGFATTCSFLIFECNIVRRNRTQKLNFAYPYAYAYPYSQQPQQHWQRHSSQNHIFFTQQHIFQHQVFRQKFYMPEQMYTGANLAM